VQETCRFTNVAVQLPGQIFVYDIRRGFVTASPGPGTMFQGEDFQENMAWGDIAEMEYGPPFPNSSDGTMFQGFSAAEENMVWGDIAQMESPFTDLPLLDAASGTLTYENTSLDSIDEADGLAGFGGQTTEDITRGFVRATAEEKMTWGGLIQVEYGSPHGFIGPKPIVVARILAIDRLFLVLLVSGVVRVPPEDRLCDEFVVHRFIRPKRRFNVSDPTAFNAAFRALQASHPDFRPRSGVDAQGRWPAPGTTKPVTQLLYALGFVGCTSDGCAVDKVAPWTIFKGGVRGDRATDPQAASPNQRDGLYYRRYVYEEARVKMEGHAVRLFKTDEQGRSLAKKKGNA